MFTTTNNETVVYQGEDEAKARRSFKQLARDLSAEGYERGPVTFGPGTMSCALRCPTTQRLYTVTITRTGR